MEETLEIKRPKLLLADDSITIRKVVELTFAEEGVDVFTVGDGDAAMQKFIEVQPDIVLVDVNMPDPDGYKICEMIKQDETTMDIPVLLLVGSFEPFDQTEAERVGADGFLTKPFQSVRDLVARVSELLGADNGFAQPPADTSDIEDLYTTSVSETYRTPDGGPTDTFLGDAGMDDDLIEASYQDGESRPLADGSSIDETVEGYDWMAEPATEVSEPPAVNGGYSAGPSSEAPLERIVDDYEDTLEVEEQPTHTVMTAEAETPSVMANEPDLGGDIWAPAPSSVEVGYAPAPAAPIAARSAIDEDESGEDHSEYVPSEEFIDIITRRVIEKLSDKAVREIAREAVPRITEKLIREALDQDKKA
jgi:CheY-like chemotaxis protein